MHKHPRWFQVRNTEVEEAIWPKTQRCQTACPILGKPFNNSPSSVKSSPEFLNMVYHCCRLSRPKHSLISSAPWLLKVLVADLQHRIFLLRLHWTEEIFLAQSHTSFSRQPADNEWSIHRHKCLSPLLRKTLWDKPSLRAPCWLTEAVLQLHYSSTSQSVWSCFLPFRFRCRFQEHSFTY